MLAFLFIAACLAPIVVLSTLIGIVKDGSPFKRDWWLS